MRLNQRLPLAGWAAALALALAQTAYGQTAPADPQPIVPGAKVLTLWPKGSPMLKDLPGSDKPEVVYMSKGAEPHILHVDNVHNPSIELHLAPAEKANGMAVIVAGGGGNSTIWVGPSARSAPQSAVRFMRDQK